MQITYKIILVCIFLIWKQPIFSTHLMGGTISYEYLGETFAGSGIYNYSITVKTYTNCDANSQIPYPEFYVILGIYHETESGVGYKKRALTRYVILDSAVQITPDLPPGCTVGSGTCIYEGIYNDTISLPLLNNMGDTSKGFHVFFNRCCRNADIINLFDPGAYGMGFYTFIPSPVVPNNSPEFSTKPLPFICTNDTLTILNSATDKDGDSLVFSYVTPFAGYSGIFSVFPTPADSILFPVPEVIWSSGGFGSSNPFGPYGSIQLDTATGISKFFVNTQGNYVTTVEIREYRDGNLISISRRDMQLLALVCPPNPNPVLVSGIPTSYQIQVGDSLCITSYFNDSNNDSNPLDDSLKLFTYGDIFNSLLFSPPATYQPMLYDIPPIENVVCWKTECHQASQTPYIYYIEAVDNGCPNKKNIYGFQLYVSPVVSNDSIYGPSEVCRFQNYVTYSIDSIPNALYYWDVVGGNYVLDSTQHFITVQWTNDSTGMISCVVKNSYDCYSDTLRKQIQIKNAALLNAGSDTSICMGDTIILGGNILFPTAPLGVQVTWTPGSLTSDSTIHNPYAIPTQETFFVVQSTDNSGCISADTLLIKLLIPDSVHIVYDSVKCAKDSGLIVFTGALSYHWQPVEYIHLFDSNSLYIFNTIPQTFTIEYLDSNHCYGYDSIWVNVFPLTSLSVVYDSIICVGDTIELSVSGGQAYIWSSSQGLSDSLSSNPLFFGQENSQFFVESKDSNQCILKDTVLIRVIPNVLNMYDIEVHLYCNEINITSINQSKAETYSWYIHEKWYSDDYDISYTSNYNQNILVSLIAYSQDSLCTDTLQKKLTLESMENYISMDIQNIFTPNGDGVNDWFNIANIDYLNACSDLYIYNRWGNLIYYSNYSIAWDGRSFDGEPASEGVYYYIIHIHNIVKKGSVTLLR